ncbi:hypothetical protein [Paraburkholderia sp. GAS42]|uniref:hypothetical protein n=1 Tax=Paraburkholderia sp. GAS42 TaxID=3035135 RepID=UPI003D1F8709
MHIELYGSGSQQLMKLPQQQWYGESSAVSQTALFAGNDMHAQAERVGKFALLYLGYKTGGFATIEAAKAAAPEFAKRVFCPDVRRDQHVGTAECSTRSRIGCGQPQLDGIDYAGSECLIRCRLVAQY